MRHRGFGVWRSKNPELSQEIHSPGCGFTWKALAARADATNAPHFVADSAGFGTTAGLPITRKVRVGVEVAAIIAGMLVLMGIINDIETGLDDLNQTSQK